MTEKEIAVIMDTMNKVVKEKMKKRNEQFIYNLVPRSILKNEKRALVVTNRFVNMLTLEETAQIMGMTRERVRQIEKDIFERMKTM
jgi:DNA-directed RNA polymerase sigma subunit (sigma70/sigma32)